MYTATTKRQPQNTPLFDANTPNFERKWFKTCVFYTGGGVLQAAGASADAVASYVYGNNKTAATKHALL